MSIYYKNKQITIIGLGLTGISCIEFFITRGIFPRVMDTRKNLLSILGFYKLPWQIKYHLGSINDYWLLTTDIIVVSPGFSLNHPSLVAAAKTGIEIIGDIEIFCREVNAPIIVITGSNGKSTVTSLLGRIAIESGIKAGIGGNIGLPVLMLLNQCYDLYILEISSFQLEALFSLRATAATILNITEDHMDHYQFNFKKYQSIKLHIYDNAKVCLFNAEDKFTFPLQAINDNNCVSFGINTGDYCLKNKYGKTWLCAKGKKVLNVKDMKLHGKHNYINALAALALADIINIPRMYTLKVISNFCGLEYRFQLALKNKGIIWINDSKSTNLENTKIAIDNLYIKGTLHLLVGGYSKSADLSSLKPYLSDKNIRLYCFGHDGFRFFNLNPEISELTESMEQSVRILASRIEQNDVVLLSPACSSIDQFKNFKQRGRIFNILAKKFG